MEGSKRVDLLFDEITLNCLKKQISSAFISMEANLRDNRISSLTMGTEEFIRRKACLVKTEINSHIDMHLANIIEKLEN